MAGLQTNYIEVRVNTSGDSGELLSLLAETEVLGAWQEDEMLHLYWLQERWDAGIAGLLKKLLVTCGDYRGDETITVTSLPDQDWNVSWARSIQPIRIGRRILIRQSWNAAEVSAGGIELVIDPKRAFGTGYHATTQLLMEWLEDRVRGSERVLDIGTGSGILVMLALRLGAKSALGIDTDPMAIECAREYASKNKFGPELKLRTGSIQEIGAEQFDIVLANLDCQTFRGLLGDLTRHARRGGICFISGVQTEDSPDISRVLSLAGCTVREQRERDGWLALEVAIPT